MYKSFSQYLEMYMHHLKISSVFLVSLEYVHVHVAYSARAVKSILGMNVFWQSLGCMIMSVILFKLIPVSCMQKLNLYVRCIYWTMVHVGTWMFCVIFM